MFYMLFSVVHYFLYSVMISDYKQNKIGFLFRNIYSNYELTLTHKTTKVHCD